MIYIYHGQDAAEGSFAFVTAALDVNDETGHCRQVAVKRMKPQSVYPSDALHAQARRLFDQERALWSALPPHSGIVPAVRPSRIDGEPVLLLDYVYGPSLQDLLAEAPGPLHPIDLLDLLDQATGAIRHLHETCGVIHGDISPENILYDGDGFVRLADLGLSCPIGSTPEPLVLPPRITAPEQTGTRRATPSIDVWKTTFCVFLALRGGTELQTSQIRDVSACETVIDRSLKRYQKDSELDPGQLSLFESLRALLRKALSPDPRKRYRDGSELSEAVQNLLRQHPDWGDRLAEKRKLKQRLRLWRRVSPATPSAALTELTAARRKLAGPDFASSAYSRLPEDSLLLARAAWYSAEKADGRNRELLTLARSMAETSAHLFKADPRPLMILLRAGKQLRKLDHIDGVTLKEVRYLLNLFREFATFVNAQQVRSVRDDLRKMAAHSEEAQALLKEAEQLQERFNERLLEHYERIESRVIDPIV